MCPGCGAPASPGHKFCPECGSALIATAIAPPPAADDDTAIAGADDVRTGLTAAVLSEPVPSPPASPARAEEPAGEGDVTMLPPRASASPPDPEVTMLPPRASASPPDPEVTMLPPRASASPPDPEVTMLPASPSSGSRAPTHKSSGTRPATNRPSTNRPATNRPSTGSGTSPPAEHMQAGEAFGARYQITKMLGVGGMGAVYQAWDAELGVAVAIKTIRPGVGTDASTALEAERRFKRELLLARQVTHGNVVRIYDLGEIEGTKYITMSYVDGQDLASILSREGKLPISRALPIMRQVSAGMGAAHAAGIVHRDLKPANIMVDASGKALVMDFGIARSVGGPEFTPAEGTPLALDGPQGTQTLSQTSMATNALTVAGSVMGTLDYMAPEQARGQLVDQRADVYALGLILRDMLLGRSARPKSGNAFQDLKERLAEPLPSPATVDPEVPAAVDAVVTRALALDPAERYPSAHELHEALKALDDKGKPLPVFKRLSRPMQAAMVAGVALLVGATYWLARGPALPEVHDPVGVVIADFQNDTGDPAFDRTLEPVMKLALEGAGFVTAYDRLALRRTLDVTAPDVFDENAARELAIKQGVGVVVSGKLSKNGDRYSVAVKAAEAVTGNVIAEDDDVASGKAAVLGLVTNLADGVREALGDDTSDTAQRFAMEALSATSLDVVGAYARGMEALSRSQFNEALKGFGESVKLDPGFGMGYAAMGIVANNLGRTQEAAKYIEEAMTRLDSMTERERFRTRGLYFMITNDYQACVKEYGDLLARYSGDVSARNNRALCLSNLRDLPTAVNEMREAVRILPNRGLYRTNLGTYAAYSGDVETAEQEAKNATDLSPYAPQVLALAQTLKGEVAQAAESYRLLGKSDQAGPSYAASGLGDLALYEGRFAEAARIFSDGAAADLAEKDVDRAATKLAALAYTELMRGRRPAAVAAAEKALATSQARRVRFLAARVLVEAGEIDKAKPIAASLAKDLQPEYQAYASIINGMIAMAAGDTSTAVRLFNEANTHLDTWIGHFELGRAYLAASAFPQADSEFERTINRRGEALALFLDEEPTYGYFPMAYYYQGKVRDGLKSARAAESYRAYLDIRGKSTDDPRVPELKKAVGGN